MSFLSENLLCKNIYMPSFAWSNKLLNSKQYTEMVTIPLLYLVY